MHFTRTAPNRIPLCPTEQIACLVHDTFDGDGAGVFILRLLGHVEAPPLRLALDLLQQRHAKLCACIETGRHGRRFYRIPAARAPIPLTVVDVQSESLPWREEGRTLLDSGLDPERGLTLKVRLLRSTGRRRSDLLLFAHHAVADGVSLQILCHDLLEYYESAAAGTAPGTVETRPILNPWPGSLPAGRLAAMRALARWVRERRGGRRHPWTALPEAAGTLPVPLWHLDTMSADDTLALVLRCRREETTVYGALFAAAVFALRDALGGGDAAFKCRAPHDLRPHLRSPGGDAGPLGQRNIGCFVSSYDRVYTLSSGTRFWTLAREASRDLRAFLESGAPALLYGLMRWLRPRRLRMKGGRQRVTLAISQMGTAALRNAYGDLRIDACTSLPKNDQVGAQLSLMAVTVGGRMSIFVNAVDIPQPLWSAFRGGAVRRLRAEGDSPLHAQRGSTPGDA